MGLFSLFGKKKSVSQSDVSRNAESAPITTDQLLAQFDWSELEGEVRRKNQENEEAASIIDELWDGFRTVTERHRKIDGTVSVIRYGFNIDPKDMDEESQTAYWAALINTPDIAPVFKLKGLERLVDAGFDIALVDIIDHYENPYDPENNAELIKWYERGVNLGFKGLFLNRLACFYLRDDNPNRDPKKACRYLFDAVQTGHLSSLQLIAKHLDDAFSEYGAVFRDGIDEYLPEFLERIKGYDQTTQAGIYGAMFFYGVGYDRNLVKAKNWLLKANQDYSEVKILLSNPSMAFIDDDDDED